MFKICFLFACVVVAVCAVEVRRDDKVYNKIVCSLFLTLNEKATDWLKKCRIIISYWLKMNITVATAGNCCHH